VRNKSAKADEFIELQATNEGASPISLPERCSGNRIIIRKILQAEEISTVNERIGCAQAQPVISNHGQVAGVDSASRRRAAINPETGIAETG
jgi:hypothetical protein